MLVLAYPRPAGAVLDIEDQGHVLRAGHFALRISNVGVVGNPWFDVGRSFDPSFEYPQGSGHELLGHAELWVGAALPDGTHRVSGGPMMEWRPTLDPGDTVRVANAGDPRGRWNFDDDHDGKVDEDPLNGKDDDGDGLIDEDFDLPSQQMMTAEYTDDQPASIDYDYPNGEPHVPLGLAVHQESYAWSQPGQTDIAGLRFVVTNKGNATLQDLRLGFYADLDSRDRNTPGGQEHDRVARVPYLMMQPLPNDTLNGFWKLCWDTMQGEAVTVYDSNPTLGLPCGAVVGLSHTTDPLAALRFDALPGVTAARAQARAPSKDSTFQAYVFAQDLPPHQGGPPVVDADRWDALNGNWPQAPEDQVHDYAVLLSCGPFPTLAPGQSVEFSVALLASPTLDSIPQRAIEARLLQRGTGYNLLPDARGKTFSVGDTGVNGHEICLDPPAGVSFSYDADCTEQFGRLDPDLHPLLGAFPPDGRPPVNYQHGSCVWTNLDCDICTGNHGIDTWHHWSLLPSLLSPPTVRVTPGDGQVTIEWDDAPEAALAAGYAGSSSESFAGYKLYRLSDWTRESLLPAPDRWARLAVYRVDSTLGGVPLASITDTSLPSDGQINHVAKHPVGRYRVVDRNLLDGFTYNYVVTSFVRAHAPLDTLPDLVTEEESPFIPDFRQNVTPRDSATSGKPHVWVVPNPYRANAPWERPAVPGDVFTKHVDFFGLPRERVTIRIYTVAGDLVARIEHDGSGGDGQAPWNLITRNGQDVESGIFLFTVDGPTTHDVGKFVLIR
ncbi:MAG TPA: hypothetical protein VMH61_06300 [Candidatus Acidoferrales bacterium]|nr:hypothetical protein [Candidatus Acidoferrales bacterium]